MDDTTHSDDAIPEDAMPMEARALLADLRFRMFRRQPEPWIGRFRLIRPLGHGAFGSVIEAEDTKLQRRTAIKVVRGDEHRGLDDSAAKRMLREAQALAKLNHPNVVQVFDAGVHEHRVWLAMELVRGGTLEQWLREHPASAERGPGVALGLLLQAGRGLAAAHALGIVHRDFKPANVLVGDDGRVRVADFGLARPPSSGDDPSAVESGSSASGTTLQPLTATGALVGTPRYMSPEQLRGEGLDARSDQFNFAATAWEVLCGSPAFGGKTREARLDAIEDQRIDESGRSAIPSAVARALRRALRAAPAERFDTMDALMDAMDPTRPRVRRVGLLAGTTLAALSVGLLWLDASQNTTTPRCDQRGATTQLAGVLDQARRDVVAAAIGAQGTPHALASRANVKSALATFADDWQETYLVACRATWEQHTASERELDARMGCLHDTLHTADALLERLEHPNVGLVDHAAEAIAGLPSGRTCLRIDTEIVPDATDRDLATRLSEARAAALAADYPTALEQLSGVVEAAKQAQREVHLGDALQLEGEVRALKRESVAPDLLQESYALAITHGQDAQAAKRARALVRVLGKIRRYEEALQWLRHADAARQRADPDAVADAEHAMTECYATYEREGAAAATEACERAAELARGGDRVPRRIRNATVTALGLVYVETDRADEAEVILEAELARDTDAFGRSDPFTRGLLKGLSLVAAGRGNGNAAIEKLREYIELTEAAGGVEIDYSLVTAYAELGRYLIWAEQFDEANAAFETALLRLDQKTDADPDDIESQRCRIRERRALLWLTQDRAVEAVEELRSLLRTERRLLPEGHRMIIGSTAVFGEALLHIGDAVAAEGELSSSVAWMREHDHPLKDSTHLLLAWARDMQDRIDAAAADYRDVIEHSGSTGEMGTYATGRLLDVLVRAGHVDEARTLRDTVATLSLPEDEAKRWAYASIVFGRAVVLNAEHDREAALAAAREAIALLEPLRRDTTEVLLLRRVRAWLAALTG